MDRDIKVERVDVEVTGDFGGPADPARSVRYPGRVHAHGSEADINALMEHTDMVSEIQNSLRRGILVTVSGIEILVGQ